MPAVCYVGLASTVLLFLNAESAKFRVYDLIDDGPPKNIHEAAERGDATYIVKLIERTIDFDINQQVSRTKRPLYQHQKQHLSVVSASGLTFLQSADLAANR